MFYFIVTHNFASPVSPKTKKKSAVPLGVAAHVAAAVPVAGAVPSAVAAPAAGVAAGVSASARRPQSNITQNAFISFHCAAQAHP